MWRGTSRGGGSMSSRNTSVGRRRPAGSGRFVPVAAMLAAAAIALPATPARAGTYAEVGDAGQTPGTAQSFFTVVGGGALNTITGTLPTAAASDVYRFRITSPSVFSASTSTANPLADTQIYLFHDNG